MEQRMERKKILVVDDDSLFRGSIVEVLSRKGYSVDEANRGEQALSIFSEGAYDLVISDMKMPGMSGIEMIEQMRTIDRDVPALIVTAFGDIDSAVEAMKKGANDYLQKSNDLITELEFNVERLLEFRSLLVENKRLRTTLKKQFSYVGDSRKMRDVRALVEKVASSRSTVLVSGESGTGKELVARSIHYLSSRSHGPFVKVNCAALPEGLIESELFGHEKGAFTGAIRRKQGKFELASGGTLLLDEIGEMPFPVQAKLLRVLQEREINKVGGEEPVEVDVRIVATTNRDLEKEVAKGNFREDLFYRLNVFHVKLPPLKERRDDIDALVEHFIEKYNEENGFSVDGVEDGAMSSLREHDWPGNIRELENTIERAVVLTRSGKLQSSSLLLYGSLREKEGAGNMLKAGMTVAEAERLLIFQTLESCGQNRTRAAEMLDISVRTLRNKLNEYEGAPQE